MIAASDIQRMSVGERFQALEMIWSSLAPSPAQVPSPGWHGEILHGRLAKVEAGEGVFLTLPELKQRLGRASA